MTSIALYLPFTFALLASPALPGPELRPAVVPSALHAAAAAGDVESLSALLAAGADPEVADGSGSPALFVRSPCDDPAVAEVLLAAGADVDHRNALGHTPLWSAALLGHGWTARVLLDAGADADARPQEGDPPLAVALLAGHLGTAELLATAGARADVRLDDGRWLVERLAAQGDAEAVRLVLAWSRGASWGSAGGGGSEASGRGGEDVRAGAEEALRTASALGRVEVLRVLLDHDVDPEAPDARGWTPLLLAARQGQAEAVDLLLAAGVGVDRRGGEASRSTPLLAAAAARREEAGRRLLAAGADPDARNRSGVTPLMFAAHHGLEALVADLVAAGADPEAADFDGKTALAFAILARQTGSVRALLETPGPRAGGAASAAVEGTAGGRGAPPAREVPERFQIAGVGDLSPVALAAGRGDAAIVRILLELGADPEGEFDVFGFGRATPLILAAAGGHAEVVEALLAHGAEPARTVDGRTARDWAREAGRDEVVAWLDQRCAGAGAATAG